MIGALTIMGIPPTSGFMAEWILFNGVLQSAVANSDTLRIVAFGLGILATVLTAAYILWMYKRIFFGKIPEHYTKIKDPNRYVIVTMATLAAITLILGVYPNPLLNPVADYIHDMFSNDSTVLQFSNVKPVSLESKNDQNKLVLVVGGGS
jgi:NADH:ubiquinone oxidoreductase subunit 4 (subunit M)